MVTDIDASLLNTVDLWPRCFVVIDVAVQSFV